MSVHLVHSQQLPNLLLELAEEPCFPWNDVCHLPLNTVWPSLGYVGLVTSA